MRDELLEHLEASVVLLVGHGSLKDRLAQVFREHLDQVDGAELPEDLQGEFQEMTRAMHCARALPGDSVISASARKLSPGDAERYANLIVRMWARRLRGVAEAPVAVPAVAPAVAVASAVARETRRAVDPAALAALLTIEAGAPVQRGGARVSRA